MAGPGCRKSKRYAAKKSWKRLRVGKRRPMDLDQIQDEIAKEMHLKSIGCSVAREFDEDLPGGGQFRCMFCARHFESEEMLHKHELCKIHKKNVKKANEPQYTQKEAEEAAGMTHES